MDVEKTMQFILEMQAKHEIAIQQSNERVARIERLIETNTTRIGQLVDVSLSLAHHGEQTDRSIAEIKELMKHIAEVQAQTDYKLNALIDTVDKIVRRNGGHSSAS